jgi:hypothetical protein
VIASPVPAAAGKKTAAAGTKTAAAGKKITERAAVLLS